MSKQNDAELPAMCFTNVLGDMERAGGKSMQLAIREEIWPMLEFFGPPGNAVETRFANGWLGAQDWRVQLVPWWLLAYPETADIFDPLVAALRRRSIPALFGTYVGPTTRDAPTAVWRVPADGTSMFRFFNAHSLEYHMLFPEDRSFAILGSEDEFAVFAGPEEFLRKVLPPELIGPAATEALRVDVEDEYGKGFLDQVLAHYDPFLLEG